MPSPTPEARAALDEYIQTLARLGDGLTLNDFSTVHILQAPKTARRVKAYILIASAVFMGLAFWALIFGQSPIAYIKDDQGNQRFLMQYAALWALALGGLGATASIFIHVLRLMPQETLLRTSDEFEVVGRIVLGFLFSTILALTLVPQEIAGFFQSLNTPKDMKSGITLLLPFLAGYSIPLVLKLLEKAIRAVELTIGLDDPRDPTMRRAARRISRQQ
jgi:hypothetical protein